MMESFKFTAVTVPDAKVVVETKVKVEGTVFASNEEEAGQLACNDVIDMFNKKRKIIYFKLSKL